MSKTKAELLDSIQNPDKNLQGAIRLARETSSDKEIEDVARVLNKYDDFYSRIFTVLIVLMPASSLGVIASSWFDWLDGISHGLFLLSILLFTGVLYWVIRYGHFAKAVQPVSRRKECILAAHIVNHSGSADALRWHELALQERTQLRLMDAMIIEALATAETGRQHIDIACRELHGVPAY